MFRVRAYRNAANYVATLVHPIRAIYEKNGRRGLEDLPTIGTKIAVAVAELLDSGGLVSLERLRGSTTPEKLFQSVPMIGSSLAHLIHDRLHIDTLEGLEAAAIDGRLAGIGGFCTRRINSIRHSLANMLARRRPKRTQSTLARPPVVDVLAADQQYRETANELPSTTPRRFNETGAARIPIFHTERGGWQFSALFSNTATAHQFNRTRDWVVI